MVESGKSNRMRWSKNWRATQALKKMFLNHEYRRRYLRVLQFIPIIWIQYFSKHLRDITEAIKSANGVDNWSGEGNNNLNWYIKNLSFLVEAGFLKSKSTDDSIKIL